jgi:MFS family permease
MKIKLAILSISFLIIMSANVVSPVLANIYNHFHDVHPQFIKMIITLPAMMIIPFSFLTAPMIKIFEKKTVVIAGLIIFTIGGVGGGFVDSIYSILLFRAILGASIGILSPLSVSLIAEFFCDAEKTVMMGYSSAANNLGAGFAAIASGYLAFYSWRYSFLLYTFALLVFILVFFFLPKKPGWNKSEEPGCLEAQVPRNDRSTFKWAAFTFLVLIIFFSIPTHLDFYVYSENLGTSATTGLMIGLLTISSFMVGIFFQRIVALVREKIAIVSFIFLFFGFLLICFFSSILVVSITVIFAGIAMGLLIPLIMDSITKEVQSKNTVFALAVINLSVYLGQFISPLIPALLESLLNFTSIRSPFIVSALLSFACILGLQFNKNIKFSPSYYLYDKKS